MDENPPAKIPAEAEAHPYEAMGEVNMTKGCNNAESRVYSEEA